MSKRISGMLALFCLFTLAKCDKNSTLLGEIYNFDISMPVTNFSTDIAKYFLHFAGFGYCHQEEIVAGKCCEDLITKEGWVLAGYGRIEEDRYNFAVLRQDTFKKIVIAFPGTRSKGQLLIQALKSDYEPFKDIKTQKILKYFSNIYYQIRGLVDKPLESIYQQYKDYQFIFTGHSLGGAMATILALDSVKYGHLKKTATSPVLITYGQPRTGNDVFANEVMSNIPIVFRVVRIGDPIAKIPPCRPKFLSSKCQTNLEDSKFNSTLKADDPIFIEGANRFNAWHIGGLKIFDKDMTGFTDCGNEYGENSPRNECKFTASLDTARHTEYFGKQVSKICAPK